MSLAELVAHVLEIAVFAGVNFAFAAALRSWFRWPRLHERVTALVASFVLTSPLDIGAIALRDPLWAALYVVAAMGDYVAIVAGLRFVRPEPPR